jgi:hypothetical protein
MSQDQFPSPGQDGARGPEDDWDPDASLDSLVAAIDAGRYEIPDEAPPEQGLYVSLPPGQLTLEGFAQAGVTDTMLPGALLATIVDTVTGEDGKGLAALSDDQLVGVLSAARRLECRIAWTQLAAIGELASRRRPGDRARRGGPAEFAADEVAAELHMSWVSAAGQVDYACRVARRLPRCFAAMAAGRLHPVALRIIDEETSGLSDADAAKADEMLAGQAPGKTFGQMRYAARRLVLRLDPQAVARRKEESKRNACVRQFREPSGNAGLVARELPTDQALASWQHVEQRALDLRAAGVPGTLQELRVQAFMDLLQERDSRSIPGAAQHPSAPDDPGGAGGTRPPTPGRTDPGPSIAALVNITVPLATALGRSTTPGEAAGLGLLDAEEVRDVLAAAARHPRTRWCLTALNPDGTAAAHACARGPHQIIPALANLAIPGSRAGPALRDRLAAIARGRCDHRHAEPGYQPSRRLAHLVTARNTKCTAPGCGRPAARCDLDHTKAWRKGGATCECNMAPLCRHHHRCKQSDGWALEQPEPGVMTWRTPSGRTYTTEPTRYPCLR